MSQDHYMPWFVGDFMAATATWSGPERGLYLQLLGIQWTSGPLPCDLERLALVLHYDFKEFKKLWPTMAGKFDNGNGKLTNPRLEAVRAKNDKLHAERSARSTAAANARWNAPSIAPEMPSDPIRSESDPNLPKPTKNPTARKRARLSEEPEGFAEFRQAFPPRAGSQPWRRAQRAWNARIGEGATPPQIIAGARRYAAFIEATGRSRTETVLQAATFLGPDKHYENHYPPPVQKETAWDEIQRLNGGTHGSAGRVFESESSSAGLVPLLRSVRG